MWSIWILVLKYFFSSWDPRIITSWEFFHNGFWDNVIMEFFIIMSFFIIMRHVIVIMSFFHNEIVIMRLFCFCQNKMGYFRIEKLTKSTWILQPYVSNYIHLSLCVYLLCIYLLKVNNVMLRQSSSESCSKIIWWPREYLKADLGLLWLDTVNSLLECS